MKDKVLEVIQQYGMIEKGDRIYIAVSGGQDSVSLLHFLNSIKKEFQLDLGIIHVNHLLRGNDSDKDDFYVKQLAQRYKLPFRSERIDVGEYARLKKLSIEEAARHCRFFCFTKIAKELNIKKIAVAHTRDDNSETVLMRIIRGSGLKGLRAIQPVLQYEGVTFIRPFIECTGYQINHYLKANKLRFRIDMSNRYIKYFRNKIRHELLPTLEQEYNPKVREALSRMAETVYLDYDFLNTVTQEKYPTVIRKEKEQMVIFNKDVFATYHEALQYRFLLKAISKIYPNSYFPYSHWKKVQDAIKKGINFSLFVGRGVLIEIRRGDILVKPKTSKGRYEYYIFNNEELFIKECEMVLNLEEVDRQDRNNNQKPNTFIDILDIEKLEFPLMIRNRRNGDRMEFNGHQREKKIKDLLIDKKVPFYIRDEIPLILSKRRIVWCWGIGSSHAFRANSETKRFLKLSVMTKD